MQLQSDALTVHVTPERGADIVQIVDRATGTPLLAVSPSTSRRDPHLVTSDSQAQWLNGYPGGWQLLVPNAGPARTQDGVELGFHGEAALAGWTVTRSDSRGPTLETSLTTVPLRLERRIQLVDATLEVIDRVTNTGADEVSFRVVQHPAFGAGFLDEHSHLQTDAATVVSDADAPGSLAAPDQAGPPEAVLRRLHDGSRLRLPGPGSGESLFAALTDFHRPEATFVSPTAGFAVTLSWDLATLPHAWLWIEANAAPEWPWFRELFAVAVEPANVLPGEGRLGPHRRGGRGTSLGPGKSLITRVALTRRPIPA